VRSRKLVVGGMSLVVWFLVIGFCCHGLRAEEVGGPESRLQEIATAFRDAVRGASREDRRNALARSSAIRITSLQKLCAEYPERTWPSLGYSDSIALAKAFFEIRDFQACLAVVEAAEKRFNDSPHLARLKVLSLCYSNQLKEAESVLFASTFAQCGGELTDMYFPLMALYTKRGDVDACERCFDQGVECLTQNCSTSPNRIGLIKEWVVLYGRTLERASGTEKKRAELVDLQAKVDRLRHSEPEKVATCRNPLWRCVLSELRCSAVAAGNYDGKVLLLGVVEWGEDVCSDSQWTTSERMCACDRWLRFVENEDKELRSADPASLGKVCARMEKILSKLPKEPEYSNAIGDLLQRCESLERLAARKEEGL